MIRVNKDDNTWDLQKQHLPSERNLLEVIRGHLHHMHPWPLAPYAKIDPSAWLPDAYTIEHWSTCEQ